MKKIGAVCILLLFFAVGGTDATGELYPVEQLGEDDLDEALALGDIEYEEYLRFLEIIKADRTVEDTELWNELCSHFPQLRKSTDNSANTEIDQPASHQLLYSQMYSAVVNEDESFQYQSALTFKSDNIQAKLKIRREFSDRERFIERSVQLNDISTVLKKLIFGNFRTTFGAGTVIAYPGKKVTFADNLSRESILFPDYGGYNGLYTGWDILDFKIETVTSLIRDDHHRIEQLAVLCSRKIKKVETGSAAAFYKISNRKENKAVHDVKISFFSKYSSGLFTVEQETVYNRIAGEDAYASVFHARFPIYTLTGEISVWDYSKKYFGAVSGSPASLLSEKILFDEIDFGTYIRRTNQSGFSYKQNIPLGTETDFSASLLYGIKSDDSTETEFYAELRKQLKSSYGISFDLFYRDKNRDRESGSSSYRRYKYRLSLFYKIKNLTWKNSLSKTIKTGVPDYLGFATSLRWLRDTTNYLFLYANFGKINLQTRQSEYLYLYVKQGIALVQSTEFSFKLSHRYDKHTVPKSIRQITFELRSQL